MPNSFTQQQRTSLLSNLRHGRRFAIGAKALARAINFPTGGTQPRLRDLIKECIEIDGDLIGAATGKPAGFFIINSLQELDTYLDTLEGRTRSDNTRRTVLINNWNAGNNLTNKQILTIT